MVFVVIFALLSLTVMASGQLLGGGYGHGYGHGHGHGQTYGNAGKVVDGHSGGAQKHGITGQRYGGTAARKYGNSYGDDDGAKIIYRGNNDKHHLHSDRNRALLNRNSNRLAGNSYNDKGKSNDGFHKVYHKEEYSKNNQFFDNDRDNKLHQNFNDYGNYYGDVDGKYYDDAGIGAAAINSRGQYGDAYQKGFYDDAGAHYGNFNHGKQHAGHAGHGHAGHGRGYAAGHGGGYATGHGPFY
ncbi:hypothetical protein CHUAL_005232 [Chamberlinius hualienensis]